MADPADRVIRSADGVELSVRTSGEGPPLVLVHGTTASKDSWFLVEGPLAERHAVWVYDRRGRGASADAEAHSLDLETDDLRAVLAAVGEPAHLLGHSYGAVVALDVAGDTGLRSLVLYEPPVHVGRMHDVVEEAAHLADAGDPEAALLRFLPAAGISDEEIAFMQAVPDVWEQTLETCSTLARELRAVDARPWDPDRHRGVTAPTLVLRGELTASPVYLGDEVRDAIPDAAIEVLAGQRHLAFVGDPEGFVRAVLGFTGRY